MRALFPLTLSGVLIAPAYGAEVSLSIEIPRLSVAEYHRPYVAIWLERPDQQFIGNVAVWYDLKLRNNEGTKWLKDLRQWWRRSGRELDMPVDGLSSATRAPGEHRVAIDPKKPPFTALAAGEYHLIVEAAREVGGREILRVPFQWPPAAAAGMKTEGKHELGKVVLDLKP
jgi:hypothetical protein